MESSLRLPPSLPRIALQGNNIFLFSLPQKAALGLAVRSLSCLLSQKALLDVYSGYKGE